MASRVFKATKPLQPKAAACIIGTEVLTGKIKDTNTHTLAAFLFDNGVDLIRTETIHDDKQDIIQTVQRLSELVGPKGFVFTSGGIGPTHDDITYESIASAFNRELELHQPTVDGLLEHLVKKNGDTITHLNPARERMALLPSNCAVLPSGSWVPFVQVENVYILPGVPSIFRSMLEHNRDLFQGPRQHRIILRTCRHEGDIAHVLTQYQHQYPDLSIGSYLRSVNPTKDFNVQITLEGFDLELLEQIATELMAQVEAYRADSGLHQL